MKFFPWSAALGRLRRLGAPVVVSIGWAALAALPLRGAPLAGEADLRDFTDRFWWGHC